MASVISELAERIIFYEKIKVIYFRLRRLVHKVPFQHCLLEFELLIFGDTFQVSVPFCALNVTTKKIYI